MLLPIQSRKKLKVTMRATRNILREYFLGRGHRQRAKGIITEQRATQCFGVGADPVCKAEADAKATLPEGMLMMLYLW